MVLPNTNILLDSSVFSNAISRCVGLEPMHWDYLSLSSKVVGSKIGRQTPADALSRLERYSMILTKKWGVAQAERVRNVSLWYRWRIFGHAIV